MHDGPRQLEHDDRVPLGRLPRGAEPQGGLIERPEDVPVKATAPVGEPLEGPAMIVAEGPHVPCVAKRALPLRSASPRAQGEHQQKPRRKPRHKD